MESLKDLNPHLKLNNMSDISDFSVNLTKMVTIDRKGRLMID